MSTKSKDVYGRPFGGMFLVMAVIAIGAIALNMRTTIHALGRGGYWQAGLSLFSMWVVWAANHKHLLLAFHRARVARKISLRVRVTRQSPGFERLVRIFPYHHDNDHLATFWDWNHKPHFLCKPRRTWQGFGRANKLQKVFERKFMRLDPEGIRYVEATAHGYMGRNIRVWFRSPADAVAFKLRHSDDMEFCDLTE